jgi:hypothetical protein
MCLAMGGVPLAYQVIVECPERRLDHKGSLSLQQEGIQKLYGQVGMILARLRARPEARENPEGCRVSPVTPMQWKGMTSKDLVKSRLLTWLKNEEFDSSWIHGASTDAVEALALALWGTKHILELRAQHNTVVDITSHYQLDRIG